MTSKYIHVLELKKLDHETENCNMQAFLYVNNAIRTG